jgi:hypothetical protein
MTETTMQYLLLLHQDETRFTLMNPAEQAEAVATYGAFTEKLKDAGVYVTSARLGPIAGAKTIQTKGGRPVTMDGPFAETKEQIGGFYLIEAPDLATACEWAARCPGAAHGAVEVRQLWAAAAAVVAA